MVELSWSNRFEHVEGRAPARAEHAKGGAHGRVEPAKLKGKLMAELSLGMLKEELLFKLS
jgi:hypothetical protein